MDFRLFNNAIANLVAMLCRIMWRVNVVWRILSDWVGSGRGTFSRRAYHHRIRLGGLRNQME